MHALGTGENIKIIQTAKGCKKKKDPKEETQVANPVHDKGLLGCIVEILVFKPEPYQKVGTKPYSFPSYEHYNIVRSHHEHQHKKNEEVHECKEPVESIVMRHIPDRIHMNNEPDTGNYQHHQY